MQEQTTSRGKALPIGGLLLLCAIWAWDALRGDLLPGSASGWRVPPLMAEAMPLGIFAVLAGLGALARRAPRHGAKALRSAALTGLGLFVVPVLVTEWSNAWFSPATRVALFSLTPVFAVVFAPYLADDLAAVPRHGLAAALVAMIGTLLVFSIEIPRSASSAIAFVGVMVAAAAVAAANCLGVEIVSRQTTGSDLSFGAVAAGSAAIGLAAAHWIFHSHHESAATAGAWTLLDLVALALLFWLMRRMSAVRMTTRFLIAPLLANLAAIAFLRPGVQAGGRLGLTLIALGSGWLLLATEGEPESAASSLRIDS